MHAIKRCHHNHFSYVHAAKKTSPQKSQKDRSTLTKDLIIIISVIKRLAEIKRHIGQKNSVE
jgi:hypothetical protein